MKKYIIAIWAFLAFAGISVSQTPPGGYGAGTGAGNQSTIVNNTGGLGEPKVIASPLCNNGTPGTGTLANLPCVFVYDDGRIVTDVTTANGSSTITCPNSDCNFVSAKDVGKTVWVWNSANQTIVCAFDFIATVNNANSITTTTASDCNANLTATGILVYGHKDGNSFASPDNLGTLQTNLGCSDVILPSFSANPPSGNNVGGFMLTDHGFLNAAPSGNGSMCGLAINNLALPGMEGGIGQTFFVMTPDFQWPGQVHGATSCPTVAGSTGSVCFGGVGINARGIFIQSYGFSVGGPTSSTAVYGSNGGRSESINVNLDLGSSYPNAANIVEIDLIGPTTHFSQGGAQINNSTLYVNGIQSCQSDSTGPIYTYTSFCANGHHVSAGSTWVDTASLLTNGQIDGTFVGIGSVVYSPAYGGIAGSLNTGSKATNAAARISCTGCKINSYGPIGGNSVGIWAQASGSVVSIRDTQANCPPSGGASANPIAVSNGGLFIDAGGNVAPCTTNSNTVLVQPGGLLIGNAQNSVIGTCTGTANASATNSLYGTGPNVTATTCPGQTATLGAGIQVQGSGHTIYSLTCTSTATTVSVACTVMVNGVAQTSTCTMTAATFCADGTHQVALNNGDLVSLKIVTGAAETGANIKAIAVWN
jgi:hypothetical protein